MNITEQQSILISTLEDSIIQNEKKLSELSFSIKVEKAKLRKLKNLFSEYNGDKTPLSEDKPTKV